MTFKYFEKEAGEIAQCTDFEERKNRWISCGLGILSEIFVNRLASYCKMGLDSKIYSLAELFSFIQGCSFCLKSVCGDDKAAECVELYFVVLAPDLCLSDFSKD